ncbi:Hypothetical predicted protein [Mytilus galloprovincialis]|uniref:Uncharacterized protein n=1 Tax=Mytilus galloprovincialis TaxID=29158 RepID=A0A8B6DR90_MYTGA|nr:Hypothetical predicted protein [Mytilus galloprovincialis]
MYIVIYNVNRSSRSTSQGETIHWSRLITSKKPTRTFEEIDDIHTELMRDSSSESKNDGGSLSSSNQTEICNDNVPDSASLDFSLSDKIGVNGKGNKCNSKPSENSGTFQQICDLESINSLIQQDSLENINELKNNDNQMNQTEEKKKLEKCLEMIKSLYR